MIYESQKLKVKIAKKANYINHMRFVLFTHYNLHACAHSEHIESIFCHISSCNWTLELLFLRSFGERQLVEHHTFIESFNLRAMGSNQHRAK